MSNIKSYMEWFHGDEHLLDKRCEGYCEYRCTCNDAYVEDYDYTVFPPQKIRHDESDKDIF